MSETTPGETPVERRLREIRESGTQCAIELPTAAERAAIDAGREALALLREFTADTHGDAKVAVFIYKACALLARCEGDR